MPVIHLAMAQFVLWLSIRSSPIEIAILSVHGSLNGRTLPLHGIPFLQQQPNGLSSSLPFLQRFDQPSWLAGKSISVR